MGSRPAGDQFHIRLRAGGTEQAMCGICGKVYRDQNRAVSRSVIESMSASMFHRGPDDEGILLAGAAGFGFRRLSIIDLSGGHQPISNEDGTVWIVFNGEIYNYQDLRQTLESRGHIFRTRTDTEVIVHLYEEHGERCVEQLRGMFAFAIWDAPRTRLFLARDRVGIKPLYYRLTEDSLIFASEIKAILADPEVQPELSLPGIDRFLTFYFMPGEETMFRDIRKLPPGSSLVYEHGRARIAPYWDLTFHPRPRTEKQATEELLSLFEESIRLHMIADVPVGFLLSGGVDSTATLGMAVGKTTYPLSSYTLGFTANGVTDERPYARLAAERYGSRHHEMTISSQEFADFLPLFSWYMEEPCCEPQAIALYYITRLARKDVKVLISGEGGDEAFAGYPIYRNFLWLERLKKLTRPFNGALSSCMRGLNQTLHSRRLAKYATPFAVPLESYYFSRTSNPGQYFNSHTSQLYSSDFLCQVDRDLSTRPVRDNFSRFRGEGNVNRMLYQDLKTSLPDDILLKADKMTMANSVELRVPLLDHKVLEFAASLPENLKIRGFSTKYIAKQALAQRVPREILERKKAGFPVPYESWMRAELKDWVYDIVLDRRSVNRGYFNRKTLQILLDENTRYHTWPKEVFSLVALELWHRSFVDSDRPTPVQAAADTAVPA
jgi:asparagine synthase (glutamine-hydrolysing)